MFFLHCCFQNTPMIVPWFPRTHRWLWGESPLEESKLPAKHTLCKYCKHSLLWEGQCAHLVIVSTCRGTQAVPCSLKLLLVFVVMGSILMCLSQRRLRFWCWSTSNGNFWDYSPEFDLGFIFSEIQVQILFPLHGEIPYYMCLPF